jgi:class 3 adenylate cyclase
LCAAILYFMFITPFLVVVVMQQLPDMINKDEGLFSSLNEIVQNDTVTTVVTFSVGGAEQKSNQDTVNIQNEQDNANNIDIKFNDAAVFNITNTAFVSLFIFTVVCVLSGLPYKIYFRRLRRKKPIGEKLKKFCKKTILYTPYIHAGLILISCVILLIFAIVYYKDATFSNSLSRELYMKYSIVSIFSLLIISLFVFSWCKFRVQNRYFEHIFSGEELHKTQYSILRGSIKNNFSLAIAVSSITPVAIVILYIMLTTSSIAEIGDITREQAIALLGKYRDFGSNIIDNILDGSTKINKYINLIDFYLLKIASVSSLCVVLIFIVSYIRWTANTISKPLDELKYKIKAIGKGNFSERCIVRSNDEIGTLAEGYNIMTDDLEKFINKNVQLTKASASFVPSQFFDILENVTISDVKLGNQVKKNMAFLFSDIRNFTSLSEKMAPEDNFNFINCFLGYMEPVISNQNGFIDKYIGDAIMALFENPNDAVEAGIKMIKTLETFNIEIKEKYGFTINIGIGIHYGDTMLGIVGTSNRMSTTVISDAVNLASRLENLTKKYAVPLIVSKIVVENTDNKLFKYTYLDNVLVKGKTIPVDIFQVVL